MICPDCKGQLNVSNQSCPSCSWEYQEKQDIPIYLSTKEKNDSLFDQYMNNYHDISVDDLESSIQNASYLHSQNEKLYSYLPSLSGLSVCEIGVGKGLLLNHIIQQKPSQLVGIDISTSYLTKIKAENKDECLKLVIANAENIPFENEFDVIIAADIIEHVFNVGDFLYCVNRALKPGGVFIVKTPDNEDITMYSTLRGCPYRFVHLRNFNKSSLKKVLKGSGFFVNKIIYDGFCPSRKRNYIKKYWLLNKIFDRFVRKRFSTVFEVNRINNLLGMLIMKPIEITAVAYKKTDYESNSD